MCQMCIVLLSCDDRYRFVFEFDWDLEKIDCKAQKIPTPLAAAVDAAEDAIVAAEAPPVAPAAPNGLANGSGTTTTIPFRSTADRAGINSKGLQLKLCNYDDGFSSSYGLIVVS